jgi:hypothetical protein
VDGARFDHLALRLSSFWSRRRFGQALATLGLGAGLGLGRDADAKKKKKKKKCKKGTKKCGKTCVNTQTNALHCGACNNGCTNDQDCIGGSCEQTGCDASEIPCPSGGCRAEGQFVGCCVEADCGVQPASDLTCNLTTHACECEIADEGKCGGIFLSQCDPCCPGGSGVCNDNVTNPRICNSTTPGDCVCPVGTTGSCPGVGCVDQLTNSEHCGSACEDCTAHPFFNTCCDAGCRYLGGSAAGGAPLTTPEYCGSCDTICGQGDQASNPFCCNSEAGNDPATAGCLAGDQLQGGLCPV